MRYLGIDLGKRHTGIAYCDTDVGIPVPLDSIHHQKIEECLEEIKRVTKERDVQHLVLGLPFLPSGEEGSQAIFVREFAESLKKEGFQVEIQDERYTTAQHQGPENGSGDQNAASACAILRTFLRY